MANKTETKRMPAHDEFENAAEAAKAMLDAEPKVRVLVPADPLNPSDGEIELGINGYFYTVRRGVSTEVPHSIAALLTRARYL